jgi:hypothetical protein
MKHNIPILLFAFSIISLVIGIFQFTEGEIWEPVLSLVYSLVFFAGGMVSKPKNTKD